MLKFLITLEMPAEEANKNIDLTIFTAIEVVKLRYNNFESSSIYKCVYKNVVCLITCFFSSDISYILKTPC